MRVIDKQIWSAVETMGIGDERKLSERDRVWKEKDGTALVLLHATKIAIITDKELQLRCGGWQSHTTVSRLNGLLQSAGTGCRIYTKHGNLMVVNRKGEENKFEDDMKFERSW